MTVLQLPAPRNVYCIGRNHSSLLATATESISSAADAVLPLLASKATSALTGPDAAIPVTGQHMGCIGVRGRVHQKKPDFETGVPIIA